MCFPLGDNAELKSLFQVILKLADLYDIICDIFQGINKSLILYYVILNAAYNSTFLQLFWFSYPETQILNF